MDELGKQQDGKGQATVPQKPIFRHSYRRGILFSSYLQFSKSS
jgi:hypothetical protein